MAQDFNTLINQPEAARDEAWEQAFLKEIVQTKVELTQNQPQQGPDGWPYLLLKTGPDGQEPFKDVVQWSAGKGVGLALNTHKMLPDYIFTYGQVWNFVETGQFLSTTTATSAGEVEITAGQKVILGEPSEKYLPKYVRNILREFLNAQGFPSPKIVVMSSQDYKVVDLVFSLESLNNLQPKDHPVMAEAIGWFLPLHYSLIFGSEQSMKGFTGL
jgi:hypothetical protein